MVFHCFSFQFSFDKSLSDLSCEPSRLNRGGEGVQEVHSTRMAKIYFNKMQESLSDSNFVFAYEHKYNQNTF